jgi:hypothetical protein
MEDAQHFAVADVPAHCRRLARRLALPKFTLSQRQIYR